MAKRIWDGEPNIVEHNGKFRIKIKRNNKLVVNEVIADSDVARKSDLIRVKKIRDTYLAKLLLDEPVRTKSTKSKVKEDKSLIKFSDAAERYRKIYTSKLDGASLADYDKHLKSHWLPHFGNWLMCDISDEDVLEYFADLEDVGKVYSTKTKKNYCQSLSNVFRTMKLDNPVAGLWGGKSRMANERTKRSRYLPEEVDALLAACDRNGRAGFNIRLYFTIAISCGLRPQELIALKWSDFDGEYLTIQRCLSNYEIKETTKTGRSRRVFVPTWARSELINAPSRFGKNWIFPNTQNNNLVKPEVFNEEWARIHAELEIPYGKASNRTPYTCRHTRAAELLTNGVPPAKGAEQLGNSVQVFLATYAEWIEEYSGLDNSLLERKMYTERGTKGAQNPILGC